MAGAAEAAGVATLPGASSLFAPCMKKLLGGDHIGGVSPLSSFEPRLVSGAGSLDPEGVATLAAAVVVAAAAAAASPAPLRSTSTTPSGRSHAVSVPSTLE